MTERLEKHSPARDTILPNGWAKVPIRNVCFLINGRAFSPSEWTTSGLPIVRIQNLNNPSAPFNYCNKKIDEKFHIDKGELLFAWSGTPRTSFGAHIWKGGRALLNQHIFRVLFDELPIDKKFFRLALNDRLNSFISRAHGGVGLRHITKRKFEETEILFPPLAEQDRIATKVEELLNRVDSVSQRLAKGSAGLKHLRQSILNAAFSGRLTEDWREQNNTKDWTNTSVKEVTTKIQYGYTASSEKNVEGPRFLRITDIQKGKVNWDEVPSCKIDKNQIMKYQLETGDIVFARTGATTGKSFLIKECPLSIFASYLIRAKPDKKKILPEFLYIFFQSDSYWEQISGKISGSAQPNCNATKLSSLQLVLPSLSEQKEIAERTERLFELADKSEGRISQAKERVDKLTQSILAKTFRGELVPTEAELARRQGRTYETAEQLLARIKLEREKKRTIELKGSEIKGRSKVMGVLRGLKKCPILEVLSEAKGKLKPEELFQKAGFTEEFVDDFYEELAKLVKDGKIEDYRPNNRLSILRLRNKRGVE